jgi:putative transposase
MPDGLRRYHHSGQSHFVTFTCYHRLPHLNTGELRDAAVEALEHARIGYRFRVYGFVVMPEHVHLLLSEPERATLAQAIQSLKIASAKRTASSRKPGAPLWQKRYYDRNIRDHDEFVEKLDYIHENPVKRNLCAHPEDWGWSSCRHYATGEDCGVEIESEWTVRKRESKIG